MIMTCDYLTVGLIAGTNNGQWDYLSVNRGDTVMGGQKAAIYCSNRRQS
jgi:hypothetical protein